MLQLAIAVAAVVLLGWLVAWMTSQKPDTTTQQMIQQHRYGDAIAEAEREIKANPQDSASHLHKAEALKLLGRFDDAIAAYRNSDDPAAREGVALSMAHLGRDLDEAKRLMEETIALYPQIQEFQALELAYVLLRRGDRDDALRTFNDNRELLETRFRDDYTDADPLLAETLWIYAVLSGAAGDIKREDALRQKAAAYGPGSIWSRGGPAT